MVLRWQCRPLGRHSVYDARARLGHRLLASLEVAATTLGHNSAGCFGATDLKRNRTGSGITAALLTGCQRKAPGTGAAIRLAAATIL